MPSSIHHGSCLCGGVRYTVTGELGQFMACHCQRCRKGSGSAHGANLFAPGASLAWDEGEALVRSYRVPDTRHARSFCSTCGSALPLAVPGRFVVIPAGSLDTPVELAPRGHIFCADRAGWEDALATAPRFNGLPE